MLTPSIIMVPNNDTPAKYMRKRTSREKKGFFQQYPRSRSWKFKKIKEIEKFKKFTLKGATSLYTRLAYNKMRVLRQRVHGGHPTK